MNGRSRTSRFFYRKDIYDVLDDLLFEFFRKNSGTKKDKAAVLAAFEKMDKESFLQFVSSNSPRT